MVGIPRSIGHIVFVVFKGIVVIILVVGLSVMGCQMMMRRGRIEEEEDDNKKDRKREREKDKEIKRERERERKVEGVGKVEGKRREGWRWRPYRLE